MNFSMPTNLHWTEGNFFVYWFSLELYFQCQNFRSAINWWVLWKMDIYGFVMLLVCCTNIFRICISIIWVAEQNISAGYIEHPEQMNAIEKINHIIIIESIIHRIFRCFVVVVVRHVNEIKIYFLALYKDQVSKYCHIWAIFFLSRFQLKIPMNIIE